MLATRGAKRVERVQEHTRTAIGIMMYGSFDGKILPPMVVYKSGNLYKNWIVGGPPETIKGKSKWR